MAINYSKEYNAEIRRVVHNFNQKRNRAIKRGFTHLPPRLLVSELKSRYETRAELNKELAFIESFNKSKDKLLKIVETEGGAKSVKWEYEYLKKNIAGAKEHYDKLISNLSKTASIYDIGRMATLENYKRQREFLDLELSELNQQDFNTFKTVIDKFVKYNYQSQRTYRGFLSEVLAVMKYAGYSDTEGNRIVEKFKQLSPEQFVKMYNESDIISKIYDIADSPIHGEGLKFNTSKDNAKEEIGVLLDRVDELVTTYKES